MVCVQKYVNVVYTERRLLAVGKERMKQKYTTTSTSTKVPMISLLFSFLLWVRTCENTCFVDFGFEYRRIFERVSRVTSSFTKIQHTMNQLCFVNTLHDCSSLFSLYQKCYICFHTFCWNLWKIKPQTSNRIWIVCHFIRGARMNTSSLEFHIEKEKEKATKRPHSPLCWHWESRIACIHTHSIFITRKRKWPSISVGVCRYSSSSSPFESFNLNIFLSFIHLLSFLF